MKICMYFIDRSTFSLYLVPPFNTPTLVFTFLKFFMLYIDRKLETWFTFIGKFFTLSYIGGKRPPDDVFIVYTWLCVIMYTYKVSSELLTHSFYKKGKIFTLFNSEHVLMYYLGNLLIQTWRTPNISHRRLVFLLFRLFTLSV